ncbi:protein-RELATED SEQUENCE 5-like isoform [Arachis hypogaea]|nr:protein-RELATED SEQUENCE 5-like isoform [Arachis hypogaea]
MFRKFWKPHWVYSALYESNSERYECSCKLWNSIGIPCSHIICVLKELEKDVLPMGMVFKRWRKDAKSGSFHDSDGGFEHNREFRGRYGSFWSACLPMCLLEAQWSTTYEYAVVKIAQLLKEVEVEVSKDNSSTFEHTTADGCGILDLKIINSKSAPRSSINGKMGRR